MSERDETNEELEALQGDPFAGESPYAILGVDRDSDDAGIRSAFRARLRRAVDEGERQTVRDAHEALARPRSRLLHDLFAPRDTRLHEEIVRRYGAVGFELEPNDSSTLLMHASDLAWGDPVGDFEVPDVPKVVFESMLPAPPRGDELVVPDRRK